MTFRILRRKCMAYLQYLCLHMAAASLLAQEAPKPHGFGKIDWALAASEFGVRAGDWASTEQGLRTVGPKQRWVEKELPGAIVDSKGGFAAFSFGMAGLEVLGQYELTKHGHRRLARRLSIIGITATGLTAANNYRTIDGVKGGAK